MSKDSLPSIAHGGKPLETVDPQPEVRKNAEIARDWEYSEEAANLYRIAVLFKDRFLDPVLLTDRRRLPDPVISFTNLRNLNTLAAYRLMRNAQGPTGTRTLLQNRAARSGEVHEIADLVISG